MPPTTVLDDDADNDEYNAPLLRDIDLLSSLLGEVIKSENECVYEVRYLKNNNFILLASYMPLLLMHLFSRSALQQVQSARTRAVQWRCHGVTEDGSM